METPQFLAEVSFPFLPPRYLTTCPTPETLNPQTPHPAAPPSLPAPRPPPGLLTTSNTPSLPAPPQVSDYIQYSIMSDTDPSARVDLTQLSYWGDMAWFFGSLLYLCSLILAWVYIFELVQQEIQKLERDFQVGGWGVGGARGWRT